MSATYNLLDEAVRAARYLMPDADEDAQTDFAELLIKGLPARISLGVVQVRDSDQSDEWRVVGHLSPDEVPALNVAFGWQRARVVEIGVCP
jgi:hypothetical protein